MTHHSLTCSPDGRVPFAPGFLGFFLDGYAKNALKASSQPLWSEQEYQETADCIPGAEASGYDRCQDGQKFVTHVYPYRQGMGCDRPPLSGDSARPAGTRHGVVTVPGAPIQHRKKTAFTPKCDRGN